MNTSKTLHLIGNAHIDPVWLWRFPDGFAEIKATFRSALDRIKETEDFIFTCAGASYYKWVEENCPSMFEEIRRAVAGGRWKIVGGMWLQPDCNMPSAESFARHFLYSQRYFAEKFGVKATSGYNVDSFGHSAALPRLLQQGGLKNYIYMRPDNGSEKAYPFPDHVYRWTCGEAEVLTCRLKPPYCLNMTDEEALIDREEYFDQFPYDNMLFWGVGNHGGGPTVTNIRIIKARQPKAKLPLVFSEPDRYFDTIRARSLSQIPSYEGELQNHASGCYSANSKIKALNRKAEARLSEAEILSVLAMACTGVPADPAANREAWQKVLFNQFHDILCGCSIKAAYDDAFAFEYAAIAHALSLTNASAQRISWSIDTSRGRTFLTKEYDNVVWEADNLGTPVVVFNPLSHPVRVPVHFHQRLSSGVTDENEKPVPFQMIRADYTTMHREQYLRFIAEVPACGWRTYWVYRERAFELEENNILRAGGLMLANDRITVRFDAASGGIASLCTADGTEHIASPTRAIVLDDSENDTWSHNHFVFDKEIGCFGDPVFEIIEEGSCQVSMMVTQTYKNSILEQIYTLYPQEDAVHVSARIVLNEPEVMIKLTFDSGLRDAGFTRQIPGGTVTMAADDERMGRELPMLRWMLMHEGGRGLAVLNDSKYSASGLDGEMRMVIARSCYYADHFGKEHRDNRMALQDIGEQEFRYVLKPFTGDLSAVSRAADELNTEFPVITETYHTGPLAQTASFVTGGADNVSVTCIKPAEDGRGIIVRLSETAGRSAEGTVQILGTDIAYRLLPNTFQTYRLFDGKAEACNLIEE